MLSIQQIEEKLKENKRGKRWEQWHDVYLGMSLHIDGVCPSFYDSRNNLQKPYGWINQEYDLIFDLNLLNRFPTEREEIRNYRKSVYKPFTRAPFLQCISVISGAIFQDSGYVLKINSQRDSDYIWGNNFSGKDLIQYISGHFTQIVEDPNGYFVVMPKKSVAETEATEEIQPGIIFIFSKNIHFVSEDEIIFKHEGYHWVINREAIYRYRYNDKKSQWENVDGAEGWYYVHGLGHKPAYVAGGIWNSLGYYDSWLVNAKPLADEHVSSYSSLQFINKDATHPYVIEADTTCPECNGVPKYQYCGTCKNPSEGCVCNTDADWMLKSCSGCGGSGKVARNPGDRMIAPADMMGSPLIQIINRDVSANKFLFEFATDLYNQMMRSLYLNYIEQAQSGVAKDKDMEARYQFLSKVAGDLFDRLIYGVVGDILGYRNISVRNGVNVPDTTGFVLIKPTHFNIQTAYDLLQEYKEAHESKMPPYQRAALLQAYNNKQFSGDEVLNKKAYIINELDFLNVLTTEEIQNSLMNGGASQRDYQFHLRLPVILNQIIRERGSDWFVRADFEAISTEAYRVFDTIIPPPLTLPNEE